MGSSESKDSENTVVAQGPEEKQSSPTPSTMSEDLTSKLKDLTIKGQRTDINILLLGDTGVGKSTFINSLFNYLQYSDFNVAQNSELNVFIPSTFSLYDKDGKENVVTVGKVNSSETLVLGKSGTQEVRTYTFMIKNGDVQIRLIDTPGMGDTEGIEKDNENCEKILNYIGGLHEINAICYLCRSQNTRAHTYFKYCVTQIMSRLHADACKNFVFVFTGSRGSDYTPGDTYQMLKQTAEEIRKQPAQAHLRLEDNKFCFDNEGFRYLAGIKQGIQFTPEFKQECAKSWKKSTDECWKMINYILDLKPHFVKQTSAINEARRVIYQLSQPMADISQLVNDNITLLQRHKANLDIDRNSLSDLKKRLYIPIIDLQVTTLTQPVTVCTDIKCSEVYKVGEKNEWHYKTRCHDPCYLKNVQKDLVGTPELINCASMGPNQSCTKCGCSYKLHMHVYYMTKKVHTEKKDDTVVANINTKELVIANVQITIQNVEQRKSELERELKEIIKSNAKFAYFLQCNAITAFNDSYEEYINYLIIREKGLGRDCDMSKLTGLQKLLFEHQEQKKIFNEAAEQRKKMNLMDEVTPLDISNTMSELFKLKHNGKKIKELYDSQKKSLNKERSHEEYKHKVTFSPWSSTEDQKTEGEQKKVEPKQGQSNRGRQYYNNRGRGRGQFNNNRGRSRPRGNSPPPPYDGHAKTQTGHHYQPPSNQQGRYPSPPPPHDPYRGPPPPQDPYRGPPPPPQDLYRGPPPPQDAYRGPPPQDRRDQPKIEVNVVLKNPEDAPPPRTQRQSSGDAEYDRRDAHYARDPYPRDPYAPRDPYPPRDPHPPRDPYPPRSDHYDGRYPYYDSRDPRSDYRPHGSADYRDYRDAPRQDYYDRDRYPPQPGPSTNYHHPQYNHPQDNYQRQDSRHDQHNRPHDNYNRNQNRPNQNNNNRGNHNNNYRGGGRGGGVNKNYKRNRPNRNRGSDANRNDGNSSDTSVASSRY